LSEAQARRILANHYYQQISSALAGSQEFMAMEKLYELHESGRYDLLVLDTPPTRHALDFLDAPKSMMGFMDEGVLKFLLTPSLMAGRIGFGLFRTSSVWMMKMLERMTGFEVLRDIADFVDSFSGMHAGFRDRAKRVEEFLAAPESTFLLVASPKPAAIDEAIYFHRRLVEYRMPFGGFIVNRVHPDSLAEPGAADAWARLSSDPPGILAALGAAPDAGLAGRLVENFDRFQALARMDAVQIARLQQAAAGPHVWRTVPAFDLDIHDLSGLARVNRSLFER